ncbi:MAG TPA: carboxypeptidase regulatory-like domain-containing protein [Ignavibacteriaceae bacterium]|nr:carboxypeptidase regulatory-like domain-containing protein [Ignavibacteriaceae bacterium]
MKIKIFTLALFTIILGSQINTFGQLLPPENLTATEIDWMNYKAVKLEWDGHGNMERFNVYKKHGSINDPGDFIRIANHIMHRVFIDHMVLPDSTYSYYVTTVNQTSESDPSDTVEITLGSVNQDLAVITGTLFDEVNNEPIADGKVRFIEANNFHGSVVTTNPQGEFIAHLLPGDYYMRSSAMEFIPEFYDNVPTIQLATLITVESGDSIHFDIGLAPFIPPTLFTLSGNVSDTSGNPLRAGIMVIPVRMNTYFHHNHHRWTVTDSLGNYSVPVREGDTVVVFCRPFDINLMPEYYDDKQTFAEADRIPVTGDITGIDFIIEPAPFYNNGIEGMVKNEENEGVEAHVTAFNLGGHHMKKYRTVTDTLGNYGFNNMIPGEYILLAIPHDEYMATFFRYDGQPTLNWREADSVVVETSGIVSGIDFIVHPFEATGFAQVTGTIKDNSNEVIVGAVVFALDEDNNIRSYAISNSNGEFVMNGFEPGNYRIFGDKFGFDLEQSFSADLDYINNPTQNVSLTLTPEVITSDEEGTITASDYSLSQNYPNPFNPATKIGFKVPYAEFVTLKVYDVLGSEVAILVNEEIQAGDYEIEFNAAGLTSGIYFYKLTAGSPQGQAFAETKKMILLR